MAILLQDDFNRADSTTAIGTPTTGGPYTVRVGTWGINSNQVYTSASVASSIVTFPAAADVSVSVTLATTSPAGTGLVLRYVDTSNHWLLILSAANQLGVYNRRAGTATGYYVQTNIATVTGGDTITFSAYGKYLYVAKNGVYFWTTEDVASGTHQAATAAGLYSSSNTTGRLDNLLAQDLTAAPVGPFTGNAPTPAQLQFGNTAGPTYSAHLLKGRATALLDAGSEQ